MGIVIDGREHVVVLLLITWHARTDFFKKRFIFEHLLNILFYFIFRIGFEFLLMRM